MFKFQNNSVFSRTRRDANKASRKWQGASLKKNGIRERRVIVQLSKLQMLLSTKSLQFRCRFFMFQNNCRLLFRRKIILMLVLPVHMCNYYTCPPALSLDEGSLGTNRLGSSLSSSTEAHLN